MKTNESSNHYTSISSFTAGEKQLIAFYSTPLNVAFLAESEASENVQNHLENHFVGVAAQHVFIQSEKNSLRTSTDK